MGHLLSADLRPLCWALWVLKAPGELTLWARGSHPRKTGRVIQCWVWRASEDTRTAGPPMGALTRPVSGSSRGSDGKYVQLPHQRPAVLRGYCEWRLGEEVGRGGGDGDGRPRSWSESGLESRLCLLLAVGPSAGHFTTVEPHLLSLQNEHVSNTYCADLLSGAEMRCVSASLGAGIKCSLLGGYSHLLTQRTWAARRGSQSQAGSQGKGILGEPPDHTQARKRRWIPQRRPEDISGHPGSRPGAGQSGQDPVASSPLPCGRGRMPTLASGPRSEKPDNKRALTAGFPRASALFPARI